MARLVGAFETGNSGGFPSKFYQMQINSHTTNCPYLSSHAQTLVYKIQSIFHGS